MSIPTLSKASEARLTGALERIVPLVAAGTGPDDAIAKIASEDQIPVGHISLLVNAYNTGRTLQHLQQSESHVEKAASFPLASAPQVLERMYPSKIDTAAQSQKDAAVSADYGKSPEECFSRRDALQLRKAARQINPWPDEPESQPLHNPGFEAREALHKEARLKREIEDRRHATVEYGYETAAALDKLAAYFTSGNGLPFQAVRENVRLGLGADAVKVLDYVAKERPQLAKQAAVSPHVVRWDAAPYSLVQECLNRCVKLAADTRAYEKFEKEATAEAADALRPFAETPSRPRSILEGLSSWDKTAAPGGLTALSTGATLQGMIGDAKDKLLPNNRNEQVSSAIRQMSDPDHEAKLQAIRVRAMLHDLMQNDPEISGHDPQDVMDSFNQLSELAPAAAQQRGLVQGWLRRHLTQTHLDPFDVDQLLGAEDKLRSRAPSTPPSFMSAPKPVAPAKAK